MRTLLEPRLVNDTFGDPGLYVDFRDEHRALLFDLGDIGSLPPRKLMRLSHVFVTHTHMDHFAGFDHLLRVVLGRKPRLAIFGGPQFVSQVEHKLRAYTWNVVHRYEVPLDIDVYEIGLDGRGLHAQFSSRAAFERKGTEDFAIAGDVLHEEATFRVRGRFVDHDIACLSYAVEEKAHVNVRKERVAELGFATGAWLRDLKHAVLIGASPDTPIDVRWRDRDGDHAVRRTVDELCDVILDVVPGRRLGYVTDLRYTESNVRALTELLHGVDSLFIECVFLEEDRDHATRKNHLTAHQAGVIARTVGARYVVPFHFSPRYEGRAEELAAEMRDAWIGRASGET
jgi:ribonuclease Z